MVETQLLTEGPVSRRVCEAFGKESDTMEEIRARAEELFPDNRVIVWEGDAQTFQFSYVSPSAEEILGYPRARWTDEAAFWTETVVHPEDRHDAVAFCALATGKCADHDFTYRATRPDGSVILLHDIVKVIKGPRGVAQTLRGIMLDITESSETGAGGLEPPTS